MRWLDTIVLRIYRIRHILIVIDPMTAASDRGIERQKCAWYELLYWRTLSVYTEQERLMFIPSNKYYIMVHRLRTIHTLTTQAFQHYQSSEPTRVPPSSNKSNSSSSSSSSSSSASLSSTTSPGTPSHSMYSLSTQCLLIGRWYGS